MRTKLSLLIVLAGLFLAVDNQRAATFMLPDDSASAEPVNVVDCGQDYECLFNQISAGKAAKVTVTEHAASTGLEEKSRIVVQPVANRFLVSMTVLELNARGRKSVTRAAVAQPLLQACPQLLNNLSAVEGMSAVCSAYTPEQAKALAMTGLSDSTIRQYGCRGPLINALRNICGLSGSTGFPAGVRKPAVYLYPLEKSKVKVAVDLKGVMTQSKPPYLKGWDVTAEPSGLIDGQFDYLFYEAQLDKIDLPQEGWVVPFEKLEEWLGVNLKELGLNEKESAQFMQYWLAELPPAKYYEIKLLEDSFLKTHMDLRLDPAPTTMIRRIFYFKPLDSPASLQLPKITTPARQGFTVVEWGGLLEGSS